MVLIKTYVKTEKLAVATVISVASLTGVVYQGTLPQSSKNDETGSNIEQTQKGKYTDGTYTGSGMGFRGETEVSVTVKNSKITDIAIVSYMDDEEFFSISHS